MSRSYGNRQRTGADRLRDLTMFLNTARPEMVMRAKAAELSRLYGTPAKETEHFLALAQRRIGLRADDAEQVVADAARSFK